MTSMEMQRNIKHNEFLKLYLLRKIYAKIKKHTALSSFLLLINLLPRLVFQLLFSKTICRHMWVLCSTQGKG